LPGKQQRQQHAILSHHSHPARASLRWPPAPLNRRAVMILSIRMPQRSPWHSDEQGIELTWVFTPP
jgi:hypothetical protein